MEKLTPREIVNELDKYIIGQDNAKKSVAIALRNRWRRRQLPEELANEVAPKNIIMIGPTGVGKTEIARRLAALSKAPFIKVEASKFTEVGYVGRDVESIVRDLTEIAVNQVKNELSEKVDAKAKKATEETLLDILLPKAKAEKSDTIGFTNSDESAIPLPSSMDEEQTTSSEETVDETKNEKARQILRKKLRAGEMDKREVEIEVDVSSSPTIEVFSGSGYEGMDLNMGDMLGNLFPKNKKKRKLTVGEARKIIYAQESEKLIDADKAVDLAIERTEEYGIVFLDEIDKIAGKKSESGPDVSREGVQRDLLPIIEGSTVSTKYGMIKTDHILFIAAGAFHTSKPSELIPELQGRFPIRVELSSLKADQFVRILVEPKNALITQYTELLKTEGVTLNITENAINKIAEISESLNSRLENIGARRLHTVLETLLEDISFEAPDCKENKIDIDSDYVTDKLSRIVDDEDLARYIL